MLNTKTPINALKALNRRFQNQGINEITMNGQSHMITHSTKILEKRWINRSSIDHLRKLTSLIRAMDRAFAQHLIKSFAT